MSKHNFYNEMQEGRAPASSTTVVKLTQTIGNLALWAYGQTVPTDGVAGYAAGCLFQDTNATGGTVLYANQGTGTSCNFDAVTVG